VLAPAFEGLGFDEPTVWLIRTWVFSNVAVLVQLGHGCLGAALQRQNEVGDEGAWISKARNGVVMVMRCQS
jgi:hypothetical protein